MMALLIIVNLVLFAFCLYLLKHLDQLAKQVVRLNDRHIMVTKTVLLTLIDTVNYLDHDNRRIDQIKYMLTMLDQKHKDIPDSTKL